MLIYDFPSEIPLAIDNDIFTHLRKKHDYVLKKSKQHLFDTKRFLVIPSTVIFQANFGIQQSLVKKKTTKEEASYFKGEIDNLLMSYAVIDLNLKASEIAAYIFARLSQSDRNKHWGDVFIVATAIAHNFGLASQNKKDMELIANHLPEGLDLRLAIWKP